MTSLNQDIHDKLKRLNVFEKIILINVQIGRSGDYLYWDGSYSNFNTYLEKKVCLGWNYPKTFLISLPNLGP